MSDFKMKERFFLPLSYEHDPLSPVAKYSGWQGLGHLCKSAFMAFDEHDADAICKAVNSHDRLVEENKELRAFLESLQLDVSNEIKLEQLLNKHGG